MKRYSARQLPHLQAAKHALTEGFEAFLNGQPISANWHNPQGSPAAYMAWRSGWLEAEAALRSLEVATDPGRELVPVSP